MPQASAGLYEVVLEQSYGGIRIYNVHHYYNPTLGDDDQQILADEFDDVVVPAYANIQNVGVAYENVRVANLTGQLADVNINPTEALGDINGQLMASFVSAAFRYNRVTKETRNGAKRVVGMVEENVQASSFTTAYNVDLDAFAVVLGTSLLGFEPVILRKEPIAANTYIYNTITGVSNLNRVTTQNSRKNF